MGLCWLKTPLKPLRPLMLVRSKLWRCRANTTKSNLITRASCSIKSKRRVFVIETGYALVLLCPIRSMVPSVSDNIIGEVFTYYPVRKSVEFNERLFQKHVVSIYFNLRRPTCVKILQKVVRSQKN